MGKLMTKILNLLKNPLFSGSFLMVGGNMFANVLNYFYQLFMGRNLGIVGYGELSSVFALFYIITIVPISASPSIVKFISTSKNHKEARLIYERINKFIWKIAIFFAILIFVLSPFLASFLHVDWSYVVLVAPVVFFSLVTISNQALMQGLLKFWGNVGPNLTASTTKLILGIVFVLIGMRVFGAVLGVLFGASLAYFYSYYLSKKFLKKIKPEGQFDFRKFLKYSLPVLVFSFSFTSFFTVDLILVKHFFSQTDAGIYATLSILGKIIYFAASPIASVMFPLVAGKHSRGEKYFRLLVVSLLVTTSVAFGIVSIYALFSKQIINIFSKSGSLISGDYLVWMGIFIALYTVCYFIMNFFLSIDKVKIVLVPFVLAIIQIFLIVVTHRSILEVIQISLTIMLVQFFILLIYLVYNRISYGRSTQAYAKAN